MNILYLGYWSINDGLTKSTILPVIEEISKIEKVRQLVLITIENESFKSYNQQFISKKIIHQPIRIKDFKFNLITKSINYLLIKRNIKNSVRKFNISRIVANGVLSISLAYDVYKSTRIPFVAALLEPHADYMKEINVWSERGLKYQFTKAKEQSIKKHAQYITVVSENYRRKLINEGVSEDKVFLIPNFVDLNKFKFDYSNRIELRKQLKIKENSIVGVYLGKFGGVYYEKEAFQIFSVVKQIVKQPFFLLILTPMDKDMVEKEIRKKGFLKHEFYVNKIDNSEVPKYLSAADFGFSTIRPSENRKYCCPIKNGEYWSCGLPILMTEGVGDDDSLIKEYKAGSTFNLEKHNLENSIAEILSILKNNTREELNNKFTQLCMTHRSDNELLKIYTKMLS